MIKIQLASVRWGMKLAKPIYTSDDKLLIDKGTSLKESYVYKLLSLGINEVYVEWNKSEYPTEHIEAITLETRREAMDLVSDVIEKITFNRQINIDETKRLVNQIIDTLLSSKNSLLYLTDIRTVDNYTFDHSIYVCLYSLIIGIALKYDKQQLEILGVGALLHDIGKIAAPKEVLNKPAKLNEEEYEIIKRHVIVGLQMVEGISDIDETVGLIIRDHHERFDGKGYPEGKRGRDIHEFARIVAICDVYDALTSDRVYKRRIPVHQAIEYLISMGNHQFDYELVKIFINQLAVYPQGTFVKLETGDIAVVVEENYHWPTRPVVSVQFNNKGEALKEYKRIDLSSQLNMAIVDAL